MEAEETLPTSIKGGILDLKAVSPLHQVAGTERAGGIWRVARGARLQNLAVSSFRSILTGT
eukprot:1124743-Pelagomonas_calceolata.AAC.2